jgi:hypothetical protein
MCGYIPTLLFYLTYYKSIVKKFTVLTAEVYIAQNSGMLFTTLLLYGPGIE